MKLFTDNPLTLGWTASSFQPPTLQATFICKLGLALGKPVAGVAGTEKAELEGDVEIISEVGSESSYASDFSPLKLAADVLLVGTAHTPRREPQRQLDVGIHVGSISKQIVAAVGPDGAPFVQVPLDYRHACGGRGFARNPHGRAIGSGGLPQLIYRHDVESTTAPHARPACFAPIKDGWEPRRGKIGSYKGDYLKKRWPWFPEDFDYSYFNVAPEDQQVKGYLRGDEDMELTNMHPARPVYRSRLPGIRPRCFVQDRLSSGSIRFREVRMNLDTLWINMDEEKGAMVWRGVLEVGSLKLGEVDYVLLIKEFLADKPITEADARQELAKRIKGVPEAPVPEPPAPDPAKAEKKARARKEIGDAIAAAGRLMGEQMQLARQQMIDRGLDPGRLDPSATDQSLADACKALAEQIAAFGKQNPESAMPTQDVLADLKQLGEDFPQTARTAPPTAERIREKASRKEPMGGTNLDGVDLSGTDFSDVDLIGCSFKSAMLAGCNFQRAKLNLADFSGADLTGADFQQANLDNAQFSEAKIGKTSFTGASIDHAIFSEMELNGADFSKCRGRGADFSKSKLNGAGFSRANTPQANFSECELKAAIFTDAVLAAARFGKANASGVRMDRADLTGLHGAEADFSGGRFRNAKAAGAIFEKSNVDGADFSGSDLSRTTFSEASAKRTKFVCCQMPKAVFDDAELDSADFSRANLLKSTFDRASLAMANLRRANCFEAGFWETRFDGTSAEEANMKGTKLA